MLGGGHVEAFADEEGKLVSILARSGDADGARPVVVQMTELKKKIKIITK